MDELQTKLPLMNNGATSASASATHPLRRRLRYLPILLPAFLAGGIIGMYFQPPGLKAFFNITGLEPGAGTSTPIATAIAQVKSQETLAIVSEGDVVALGRLIPKGDVITVAPPFGSADARLASLEVAIGDAVVKDQTLALLDNSQQFKMDISAKTATVELHKATLVQTRRSIEINRQEAKASLARAQVTFTDAKAQLERSTNLFKKGVIARAEFDVIQTRADEATRDVERAKATLTRFTAPDNSVQPDVAVAQANLSLAQVELQRSQQSLEKSIVRSPENGTILDINIRPGEKPGSQGILKLGNVEQMTVEVEVYQSLISRVTIADPVVITSDSLETELSGFVSAIGLEIGKQTITSDDPAANTDARVVDVIVTLDKPSSELASRFTNLEVIARIDAGSFE